MTAQNQKLSAITASLTKIAADLQAPAPQAGPVGAPQPAAAGPEEIMALVDQAVEILEVASEQIPAEKPEAAAPVAQPAAPITAKSKSARDEGDDDEDDDDKQKDAADHEDDDDKDEDEEKKEMTARIATLEGELFARQKSAIADEFVQLYNEDVRQAKHDEIMSSKDSIGVLTAQLKVAKEIAESGVKTARHIPVKTQGGYLVKTASMDRKVPAWRT